jgi:hypothetical protein
MILNDSLYIYEALLCAFGLMGASIVYDLFKGFWQVSNQLRLRFDLLLDGQLHKWFE